MPPPSRKRRAIIVDSDGDDDSDYSEEISRNRKSKTQSRISNYSQNNDDDDDSDEDSDYSQEMSRNRRSKTQNGSQISGSQTQDTLNEAELLRLASLCANYFLVANCKKVPIKRSDVGKVIPKEYSRKFGSIMKNASLLLERVFGYKIVELDKKGQLIVVNILDLSSIFGEAIPFSVQNYESAVIPFRTQILIAILMSGGVVSESTLNEFVRNFGADVDSKESHPVLGNVQKLIYQNMVRQGYLEIVHHKDCDESYKDIKWGGRAKMELNKKEVIELVCKHYGEDIKPEMWIEQWKDALLDATA